MADGISNTGPDDPPQDPGYRPPFAECSGTGVSPPPPPNGSLCLVDPVDPVKPPLAIIEHEFVNYMGVDAVHISAVLDPSFVDNTYGATARDWGRSHTFKDLVGSDKATIVVLDSSGTVVFDFDLDYISEDPTAPCGYSSLGPTGREGKLRVGDLGAILDWTSSLDRNLNERGYCLITDSPATDASCTPNPAAPDWDFRVVYEVWLATSAFQPAFGSAYMSFVHASPSKASTNTMTVEPGECPCVEIDRNQCEPPSGDPPPGDSCTSTPDCPSENFCYDGHCIPIIL